MTTNSPDPAARVPLSTMLRSAATSLQAQSVPPLSAAAREAVLALQAPRGSAVSRAVSRAASPATSLRAFFATWSPRGWPVGTLTASGVTLLLVVVLLAVLRPVAVPVDASRALAQDDGFVPLVPAERWERLAGEGASSAWLVPTEMPRARLAAMGLPYDPGRAAETVRAELLMQGDGEVLAVRLLR